MKREKLIKLLRVAGLFVLFFALVGSVFGMGIGDAAIGGGGAGALIAQSIPGVVTTETVKEQSEDLLRNDIDNSLVELEPSKVPLDTLIRKISNRQLNKSLVIEHYAIDYKGVADTVATGGAITAAGQTTFDLKPNNLSIWTLHDCIAIDGLPAYADLDNAVLPQASLNVFVHAVDRANGVLKVQPVNGFKAGGVLTLRAGDDIAEGAKLIRLGKAGSEKQIQTGLFEDVPTKDVQYMQKFMAQIEESTWAKIHAKEVDWGWDDYSRRMLVNMRIEKELAYKYNTKRIITDVTTGETRYITGGAAEFVTGETDLSAVTLTNATWQKVTREIFQGNSGSDQRWMLAGDLAIQQMGEIDDIQAQTKNKKRETMYGLTFNRINTNFGELLIVKDDLAGLVGRGHEALVIDPNFIHERHFEPMRAIELDKRKSGEADVDSKVIIETACPLWKYPDVHRWLRFKTA